MLAARLAERDMILLTDWEAADKLNQVDVTLPPETVWTATAWGLADFMDLMGIAEAAQFLNAAENYPADRSFCSVGLSSRASSTCRGRRRGRLLTCRYSRAS